jgi:hypothetical protein
MPVSIENTVIRFNDNTTQSTAASGSGQIQTQLFTGSGSWTAPAGVTRVEALAIGGGGGSNGWNVTWGGNGGFAHALCTVVAGTAYTVTVGLGGAYQSGNSTAPAGGTSSFGSFLSATGGGGAPNSGNQTSNSGGNGNGTVSSGAVIKTGNISFDLRNHVLPYNEQFTVAGETVKPATNSVFGYLFSGATRATTATTFSTASPSPAGGGGMAFGRAGNGGIVFLRWVGA